MPSPSHSNRIGLSALIWTLLSAALACYPGVLLAAVSGLKGAERLAATPLSPVRSAQPGAPEIVPSDAPIQIRIGPYFGWDRSWTVSNGKVEAVIVPAIGRLMQFRFLGQGSPFWEDPALRGKLPDPASSEWQNFGGDKTWPAPQADWERITARGWPPPVAFDSMPVVTSVRRDAVVLTSPIDPHFGIRTERVIRLEHEAPVMTIVTTYEKVSGDPAKVGVWIITQLEDPLLAAAPVPSPSHFPEGYNRQSGDQLPSNLTVEKGLLTLTRDPARSTKIGTDSERLLWVGETQMLLIESPRIRGADYPDQQSSAEIYTNPDPKAYVELETLGPLHDMKPGDRIRQTNTYTLLPRQLADPKMDARRVLFGKP